MKQRKRRGRRPQATRVVGYVFEGEIDVDRATKLLARARDMGVVTQFDSVKSMTRGMDGVWFNGPPGSLLRALRSQVAALVRTGRVP